MTIPSTSDRLLSVIEGDQCIIEAALKQLRGATQDERELIAAAMGEATNRIDLLWENFLARAPVSLSTSSPTVVGFPNRAITPTDDDGYDGTFA